MLDSASQYFFRALEFHKAGRLNDAEGAYLALLQKSPNHSSALHNMGVVLAQKRKQIEAISYFDRAIVSQPDYAEAFNNRGSAQLALGHLQQAVDSYNQALKCKPAYSEASLNLANVLIFMNSVFELVWARYLSSSSSSLFGVEEFVPVTSDKINRTLLCWD